jgi:pimeloyl-[acyl-carrier protein] methyl ester esterase
MVTLVLLPGMEGTGSLFGPFIAALEDEFNVKVVSYPTTESLGYMELESIARAALPSEGPFTIHGDSISDPIAVSLAASSPSRLTGNGVRNHSQIRINKKDKHVEFLDGEGPER